MLNVKCIFVSDIHGKIKRYDSLFKFIQKQQPDGIFFGGDLLPHSHPNSDSLETFISRHLFSKIQQINATVKKPVRFFLILGNDDPRIYEDLFFKADSNNIVTYVHNKTVSFGDFFVTGYSYVPPTPFQLKDWERYDVSRHLDVGAVSPESGYRTIDAPVDDIRYTTIAEDLDRLSQNAPADRTIWLFHSPPYQSDLDRAALDGKMMDHAPLDVHVGSIAIQRFIKKKQPLLTLHGHVHESARLTGEWKQRFGRTYSFSAAHDGPELAVIRFDTDDLNKASKELVDL